VVRPFEQHQGDRGGDVLRLMRVGRSQDREAERAERLARDRERHAARDLDGIERQRWRDEPELTDEAEALSVDVRRDGEPPFAMDGLHDLLYTPPGRADEQVLV
jgi:hypothetical protein